MASFPLYRQASAAIPTVPVLEISLALLLVCWAWELYLKFRQRRMYGLLEIPTPISNALGTLSNAEATKALPVLAEVQKRFVDSQRYGLAKSSLGLIDHCLKLCVALITLGAGALPAFYDAADAGIRAFAPAYGGGEISTTIAFLFLSNLVSWVVDLPLDLYRTFVLEAEFGFNKQVCRKQGSAFLYLGCTLNRSIVFFSVTDS